MFGDQLTYMTVPSDVDRKKGKIIDDPANTGRWARIGTYGGSLLENIVQAFCRDLLVDCVILPFRRCLVLHVHDEGVIEVPRHLAEQARIALDKSMNTPKDWYIDFPLFTKAAIMERYGK